MHLIQAIVPVFALVMFGNFLRRIDMPGDGFWEQANKLCFWVFVPALLFGMLAKQKIQADLLWPFAVILAGSFFLTGIVILVSAVFLKMADSVRGAVMQGALQHNTFISLALAEQLYGSEGLVMAAMASGILVFVTNISIVPTLLILNPRLTGGLSFAYIFRSILSNPLIISICLGLGASLVIPGPLPVLQSFVDMLGSVTLPLVLLCVGAGLKLRGLRMQLCPLVISTLGKLLLFPMFALLMPYEISPSEMAILMLFAAVPTAPIASALAAQTGGDVLLMNAIITVQTALSFVTLPLTIAWATLITAV